MATELSRLIVIISIHYILTNLVTDPGFLYNFASFMIGAVISVVLIKRD